MKLKKFFVVFVTLFGTMCWSKIVIKTNETDGFAELEEAAMQILTTCYENQNKTVVVIGEFPENFVRKLSAHRSFSVVLIDARRRAERNVSLWVADNNYDDWNQRNINIFSKTHIAVTIAPNHQRVMQMVYAYLGSPFFNRRTHFLIIGWSSENKYAGCDGRLQTGEFLFSTLWEEILDAKLLCRNRKKGIVIYDTNPFIHQAPEPWESADVNEIWDGPQKFFVREYRKHEGMCKNLVYDKTHDLGGAPVKTQESCVTVEPCTPGRPIDAYNSRIIKIQSKKRFTFIDNFFPYVNATRVYVWKHFAKGGMEGNPDGAIITRPLFLNGMKGVLGASTYPHGQECKYFISQFRGNKSQLEKIVGTIDSYSWIGMVMVYFITWMFFKYFLHQPLLVGIFDLLRLTCNFGLTTVSPNVSSRIYLGCLFFFVVTMQGIFVGNLASLLTHDIPVRQVNTIKDVADLGYTIYVLGWDLRYFADPIFKNRCIEYTYTEDCLPYIERDPLAACLTWSAENRDRAANSGLYVSPVCFNMEYVVSMIPFQFFLETTFDKYLKITLAADIMLNLDMLVNEKRLLEAESEEVPEEPRVMILSDLGFAFAILAIGLGCSLTCFIIEMTIDRFQRRVTTSRVIVL